MTASPPVPKTLFCHTEEVKLPAADLHRYPANRIPHKDSVAAMRDSIAENGQLQPITARPLEMEDGSVRFEIIFGETRVRACQAIAPTHPVRCYIIKMTDAEAAKIHAVENFQRKELDPIEEAQAMENMRTNGWEVNAIADTLGIDRKTVSKRLRLLTLDDATLAALRENTITLNVADTIAGLAPADRNEALELCVNPTHSAEPLSQRDAQRQIEMHIIAPRKKLEEWESKRPALEKKHPDATFLDFPAAKKAQHWESDFEPIQSSPHWKYQAEAVRSGRLENKNWGELAKKWGAEVFIGLPVGGEDEYSLLVAAEPLVAAELAECDGKPLECIFQHPKQRREAELNHEKKKALLEARREAMTLEFREALLIISRPEAIQPAAAERLCIEFFNYMTGTFDFAAGLIPGFEDVAKMETEEFEKTGAAYLKTKEIRGFEALGRLYVMSQLDMRPSIYSEELIARTLIGTKALREADFPMLSAVWKQTCANQLAADELELESTTDSISPTCYPSSD